jgi:hypothetical protein
MAMPVDVAPNGGIAIDQPPAARLIQISPLPFHQHGNLEFWGEPFPQKREGMPKKLPIPLAEL